MRSAIVLAALTLAGACSVPPKKGVAYAAHPNGAPGERIVHRAIAFEATEVPTLRKAGGLPLGTLTMQGEWKQDELLEAVAKAAADRGGTHFMAGEWSGSPASWSVRSVAPTTTDARFVVVRVPANAWHRIPPSLVPEPYAGVE